METKLQEELNGLLLGFAKYWEEEKLLKSKVIEDLRNYDKDLLNALLENELIKETYSLNVSGTIFFKVEDFISLLRYKNYFENSYTKFSNEIGLTEEGKFLKYSTDVVLDFPFKDCVLEGGMSKDDEKKNENFYHTVLAKEEVDVLLSPKTLTNVQRISHDGNIEIKDYTDENLIIRGNNLIALKTVERRFANDIDVIYIDPPYNVKSSNNTFLYNNRFNRSTWLVFMKNRLEIAKRLLNSDGALIIAIDENEQAYLAVLLDEMFPEYEKHLITIVHNPRGVQGSNFSYMNEFAYFVIPKGKKTIQDRQLSAEEVDWSPLRNWGGESLRSDAKNCFYPIIIKDGEIIGFGDVSSDDEHPSKNEYIDGCIYVYPIDNSGIERKWRYARQSVDAIKNMLRPIERSGVFDIQIGKTFGQYKTVWQDAKYDANGYGKQVLNKLVPNNPFTFPKSIYTVYDCLHAVVGNKPNAKILDFFGGSGTTGHATLMLNQMDQGNRKFILIEQMEYADTVIKERMKKLIQNKEYYLEQKESFYYMELSTLNQDSVESIQKITSEEDLSNVIKYMKEVAFFDYKVNLNRLTDDDSGFNSLTLEDKKDILIKSLDANQMYLSYSEIEDEQYEISDIIKQFNNSFYKQKGSREVKL